MPITSFQLLLTATTIGIAAWAFVVDSPKEQVNGFEKKEYKMFAALSILFSFGALLLVIGSMTLAVGATPGLGSGGAAFYWVLLGITVVSAPKVIQVLQALMGTADEFKEGDKWRGYAIAIPYTIAFLLALSWGLFFVN